MAKQQGSSSSSSKLAALRPSAAAAAEATAVVQLQTLGFQRLQDVKGYGRAACEAAGVMSEDNSPRGHLSAAYGGVQLAFVLRRQAMGHPKCPELYKRAITRPSPAVTANAVDGRFAPIAAPGTDPLLLQELLLQLVSVLGMSDAARLSAALGIGANSLQPATPRSADKARVAKCLQLLWLEIGRDLQQAAGVAGSELDADAAEASTAASGSWVTTDGVALEKSLTATDLLLDYGYALLDMFVWHSSAYRHTRRLYAQPAAVGLQEGLKLGLTRVPVETTAAVTADEASRCKASSPACFFCVHCRCNLLAADTHDQCRYIKRQQRQTSNAFSAVVTAPDALCFLLCAGFLPHASDLFQQRPQLACRVIEAAARGCTWPARNAPPQRDAPQAARHFKGLSLAAAACSPTEPELACLVHQKPKLVNRCASLTVSVLKRAQLELQAANHMDGWHACVLPELLGAANSAACTGREVLTAAEQGASSSQHAADAAAASSSSWGPGGVDTAWLALTGKGLQAVGGVLASATPFIATCTSMGNESSWTEVLQVLRCHHQAVTWTAAQLARLHAMQQQLQAVLDRHWMPKCCASCSSRLRHWSSSGNHC